VADSSIIYENLSEICEVIEYLATNKVICYWVKLLILC